MTNSTDLFIDFNESSIDAIVLAPEQIERSAQLADAIPNFEEKWSHYLNNLALFGFESWLDLRVPEMVLDRSEMRSISNAVYSLKVDRFKLCLLSRGTIEDLTVSIPSTVIDTPSNASHFYISIAVYEEREEVTISAIVRYDRLVELLHSNNLSLQEDLTYEVPLAWFDREIDHLLLYLRCLEPSAIQLPIIVEESPSQNISKAIEQSVINVALWLQNRLDETAENLSWLLLPNSPLAASSFRSLPTFESVVIELTDRGLPIPNTAARGLLELQLGENNLQLYSLVWQLDDSNEWSILFILGTPDDRPLPVGLNLEIRDETNILSSLEADPDNNLTYLYSRAIGDLHERFTVTIALRNGESLTLPAFTFSAE